VPTSSLRIDIFDTSLFISADEEPGYLENIFSRYCISVENARKITGLSDPLKLAIMTGFLLCDDIQKNKENADSAEQIFIDINTRIDEILNTKEPNSPSA
jgi:cell division protein ZapA (FtsZ GTPase activity inhibitor)